MSQLEDSDRMHISARQDERLRSLLREVGSDNAFVRQQLERAGLTVSDCQNLAFNQLLNRLPFTTKRDLVTDQAAHPPYGSNLTFERSKYSRLHQTSGTTTGVPLRWLDTPQSWQWVMDCWAQLFRIAGLSEDDRLFFPFSFGPFLGFWAGFESASRLGHFCVAGGGMTSSARLRMLFDNEFTVVCCTPTYALRLAETAIAEGLNLAASSVRTLLVAGEPGGSIGSIRQRLEASWGARVIDHWGMTELGPLAIECAANPGGQHVLETECVAEIIDSQTGLASEPDADGVRRGELVITSLGRIGSPLIRYRTGDLVLSSSAVCPCGRDLLRLDGGILGRADDMLIIRGNNVFPSSIESILREFDEVVEYRLEVRDERSMTHLRIQIEPISNLSEAALSSLLSRITSAIKDRLNFMADLQLVPSDSLPRFELKGRRVVRISE